VLVWSVLFRAFLRLHKTPFYVPHGPSLSSLTFSAGERGNTQDYKHRSSEKNHTRYNTEGTAFNNETQPCSLPTLRKQKLHRHQGAAIASLKLPRLPKPAYKSSRGYNSAVPSYLKRKKSVYTLKLL
jgi:hypothetical protein